MQKQTKNRVNIKLSHQNNGIAQPSKRMAQGAGSSGGSPSKNQVMAGPSLEGRCGITNPPHMVFGRGEIVGRGGDSEKIASEKNGDADDNQAHGEHRHQYGGV